MPEHSPISNNRSTNTVIAAGCVMIALLFLSASILKSIDAPAFRNVVGDLVKYMWPSTSELPEPLRYPGISIITTTVITLEAAIAALILLKPTRSLGLKLALVLLIGFTGILTLLLFMPNPPSCGCLGGAGTSSNNATIDATVGITRNIALIVLAFWILKALGTQHHQKLIA